MKEVEANRKKVVRGELVKSLAKVEIDKWPASLPKLLAQEHIMDLDLFTNAELHQIEEDAKKMTSKIFKKEMGIKGEATRAANNYDLL